MGNVFGGGNADEEEEEDDERLRRWRPALEALQYGALKRKKISKSSESSDDGSGHSDGQSDSSSAGKMDSESEKSDSQGDIKSDKSGASGKEGGSDEDSDADDDGQDLVQKDMDKKKKKFVVRMDFEPLLALHEPLADDIEPPTALFAQTKKRRKAERAERASLEDAMTQNRRKAKTAAEWMADMGLEECSLRELARSLGEDIDELRYALVQSRRFTVDEDDIVRRALLQRILDVMESDIETLQEVLDKLMDSDDASVKAAIAGSHGELRLKMANDIELVEHVDIEAELKLQREEERQNRHKEKEEQRRAKLRRKRGKGDAAEDEDSSDSSSGDEGGGVNKEAERKALAFRRLQVQRKIEEFLKIYTRGQNLTKINSKGQRYHRRVYVDTSRKALVVQGANGPKFFPFASMKEVDIETRTTKEGRVETLVICAIEKRGRIVKELYLAFPDQTRANTFVNCVTLFSLALRHAVQK